MDRTIRISGGLYACIIINYLPIAQLLFLPAPLIRLAHQEAWLSVVLDGLFAALLGLLVVWIAVQFGRKSPVEAARAALGKALGGLAGLLYGGFAFWLFALVLRDVQDFTTIILLPGTPGVVVAAILAAVSLYAIRSGLEPMARVAFQALVALVAAITILPLLVVREFSILHISPFLSEGMGGVLQASLRSLPWFTEIIFAFSLVPYLSRPKEAYRWTLIGVSVATLIVAATVGLTVLVFGPILPSRLLFPSYDLLQAISLAQFIERIEVIFVVIWVSSMFIKACLSLYVAVEGLGDGLGIRNHRWLSLGLAAAGVWLANSVWSGILDLAAWGGSLQPVFQHLSAHGAIVLLFFAAGMRLRKQNQVSHHA